MAKNLEQENEKSADSEAGEGTTPTNAELFRMLAILKLKLVANYVLDGFPPVVAVIALIVAVIAMNENKSTQAQLSNAIAKIDSMSASMQMESKGELDKVKAAMAQERLLYEEERNKQNERAAQLVQNISKLQVKMKISPTLEEQLRLPVAVSAVVPVPEAVLPKHEVPVVAAPAKVAPVSKVQVQAPAPVAPAAKVPAPTVKVQVPSASADADKKVGAQVQTIKQSIEQFNKK